VGLNVDDVLVDSGRPHIRVRAEIAKRHKARTVPLWLDSGTLSDLIAWKAERSTMPGNAFICSVRASDAGRRLIVRRAQRKYKQAIRCLGAERVAGLSIHAGRHTFCSLALDSGRSLVQVRDWAGHSNIATTNIYLHSADGGEIGNDFA
jgi:integrase